MLGEYWWGCGSGLGWLGLVSLGLWLKCFVFCGFGSEILVGVLWVVFVFLVEECVGLIGRNYCWLNSFCVLGGGGGGWSVRRFGFF